MFLNRNPLDLNVFCQIFYCPHRFVMLCAQIPLSRSLQIGLWNVTGKFTKNKHIILPVNYFETTTVKIVKPYSYIFLNISSKILESYCKNQKHIILVYFYLFTYLITIQLQLMNLLSILITSALPEEEDCFKLLSNFLFLYFLILSDISLLYIYFLIHQIFFIFFI